jgi:hypothetical protein
VKEGLFYGRAYKSPVKYTLVSKTKVTVKLFLPSFLIYSVKLTKIVLTLYLHLLIAQLQRLPLLQGHHWWQFLIASFGVPCTSYVHYPRTSYVAPAPPYMAEAGAPSSIAVLNDSMIKITKRLTKKNYSLLPRLVNCLCSRSARNFHPSSISINRSSLVRSSVGGQYWYDHQQLLYKLRVCVFLWVPTAYISPLSSQNHTFPFTSYSHSFTTILQQLLLSGLPQLVLFYFVTFITKQSIVWHKYSFPPCDYIGTHFYRVYSHAFIKSLKVLYSR